MRDLIVSIVAVGLLIGSWLLFYDYSETKLSEYASDIENNIIPLIESETWDESRIQINQLSDSWHRYRKTALLFLDTETINEIDYSMARSIKYVLAEDLSNSSGELYSMHEQLMFLIENDKVSLANIM